MQGTHVYKSQNKRLEGQNLRMDVAANDAADQRQYVSIIY